MAARIKADFVPVLSESHRTLKTIIKTDNDR